MLLSLTITPIAALLPALAAAPSTGKTLRPVPGSPSLPFEPAMQEQSQPLLFSQEANRVRRKHHAAVLAPLSLPLAAVAVSFIVFTCYKALTASRTGASDDLSVRRLAHREEGLCSVSRLDSERQETANTRTNEVNEDVCLFLVVSCFCSFASNVELLQWQRQKYCRDKVTAGSVVGLMLPLLLWLFSIGGSADFSECSTRAVPLLRSFCCAARVSCCANAAVLILLLWKLVCFCLGCSAVAMA